MLDIRLLPFRTLQTPRLTLRQLAPTDAADIAFFRSNAAMLRYIPREKDATLTGARQYLQMLANLMAENSAITWGLSLPGQTKLVGTICLWNMQPAHYRAEVGYGLHPSYWGQGLMSEALAEVLRFGFEELGLHSIEACLDPSNRPSIRLLERHGFTQEAHLQQNQYFRGQFIDTLIYSLLSPQAVPK
ncbi:GNAT family N-acetyltransferase [Hymenobacter seoulensis]